MTPERITIVAFIAIGFVALWKLIASYYKWKRESRLNPQPSKPKRSWADDPIAKSIEWTEVTEGGANFGTHELHRVSGSRVEFQPRHPRSWYIAMLLMGVGGAIFVYIESGSINVAILAPLMFMGLCVFGWLILHFSMKPVVFDKHLGMFWEGRKQPDRIIGHGSAKCLGRIDDIYALQLIDTYITTGVSGDPDSHTYYNIELNLVMKDGARLNAMKHGDTVNLHKDAEVLSEFLGKPLWDAR
jgi:hypothetical protein